jgi:mRNA interferase MazF
MKTLKKGDIVTIRSKQQSHTLKSRPAIVYQNELFNGIVESITIVPLSSTIIDAELFRISIIPNKTNNLSKLSQVMTDKITTVAKTDIGEKIGNIDVSQIHKVDEAIKMWLDID